MGVIDLNGFDFFPCDESGIGSVKNAEEEGAGTAEFKPFCRTVSIIHEKSIYSVISFQQSNFVVCIGLQFIIFI